jgi:hypothetical protein
MPFDHLTLAAVAECERLLRLDWRGDLHNKGYGPLKRLLAKRHPPLYDPLPPPSLPRIA